MNRKTTPKATTQPAAPKTGKSSQSGKAKSRQPKPTTAQQDSPPEQQPFPTRPVQLHQLYGYCGVVLDPGELGATDPQIIERFRAALVAKSFFCLFSTETDVFDLELTPVVLPALARAADGSAQTTKATSDGGPEQSGESPIGG
jgi:hypothetical protein